MLQKTHMKIMACAIYTYLFFLIDTLSSLAGKYKVVVIAIFLSKSDHRSLFIYIYYKPIPVRQ